MLGKCLNKIREHVENWCRDNNIPISIVCDTVGIQGVKIFEKNQKALRQLFEGLTPVLKADNVFLDVQKVRGGTILAFSIRALTESEVQRLLKQIGETGELMTFADRISDAFILPIKEATINLPASQPTASELEATAYKIAEDQYKHANAGITRSNQSSRQRNLHTVTMTHGGEIKKGQKKKQKKLPFESTIRRIFNDAESTQARMFSRQLREALDGMATPDGAQPGDLFQKFARSLAVLGKQMGIGPLQDQLKKQGINWKKSDDGQAIILFIVNAQTKAPQPIARISAETLAKPNEFEEQLLHMIDFSKGEAPGAFKQHQAEIKAQEKAVRDIARTVNPQDQSVINQMATSAGSPQNAQAPAPAQAPNAGAPSVSPANSATDAAAAQAAAPKPPASPQAPPTGQATQPTSRPRLQPR